MMDVDVEVRWDVEHGICCLGLRPCLMSHFISILSFLIVRFAGCDDLMQPIVKHT